MQYILFMMFLITSPGQSLPKDKRVFVLQSTQSIEFESSDACRVGRNSVAASVAETDTILLVSWCLPKGVRTAADAAPVTSTPGASTKSAPAAAAAAKAAPQPDEKGIIQFRTMPGR